jgi:7,8-dihydro-6-hydroxymethylpterin dimethyltransferase
MITQHTTIDTKASLEAMKTSGRQEGSSKAQNGELELDRLALLRYAERLGRLPYATTATCPGCGEQTTAEFARGRRDDGVELHYDCPRCGKTREDHADTIWSIPPADRTGSAATTFSGETIKPNLRTLPRTVQTLCPTCCAIIAGRYFVEDGMVWIEKSCPEHGYFRDIINRDARLYLKAAYWSFEELRGVCNPHRPAGTLCPADCGLCGRHQSAACLANLDLTNRCNLNCPVCFANANISKYVYEPDFDQVVGMMQALRDLRPTPATAIQFSGGEPTLHPRFLEIVSQARHMGFSNIQIATNGLKLADGDFAKRAREAGLHTLYLQFDGTDPAIYKQVRGRSDLFDIKCTVVENCRRADLKICLVPTIIRTVNDHQVGPIFNFAVENADVISGISYQPVCFTGRIDTEQRLRQRYTLGDLAHDIAKASGASAEQDFYPLSVVMPLAQLLETVTGNPKVTPSCHTDCAFGSYFLISPDKKAYPFPRVLDIERMFSEMNRLSRQFKKRAGRLNILDKWRIYKMFKGVFRPDQAPPGLTVKKLIQTMQGMVDKNRGRGAAGLGNYRTLMAAGMHFQDRYNYDVERVKRCVIPYSTPAGLIPFCSYNGGPCYRSTIERMFSTPK